MIKKIPIQLNKHLTLWANLENGEIMKTMSYSKVSPMFREYQPDTSWREIQNRHEWSTDEVRGVEAVAFEMSKLALYDQQSYKFLRHYWRNSESVNQVKKQFGGGRKVIERVINNAHNYLIQGLGYDKRSA